MRKALITALCTLAVLFQSSVYAEQSLGVLQENDEVSVGKISTVVNEESDFYVEVTLTPENGESTVIYTGALSGYAEEMLEYVDFSDIDAVILFDWETDDTYVIKKTNVLLQEQIKEELKGFNNTDIDKNAVQSTTRSDVGIIEYDVEYEIANNSISMEIDYNVFNGGSQSENVTLIAALYEDNKLSDIKTKQLNSDTMNSNSENITLQLPDERDSYSIKLMVWDSIGTMKPLGNVKPILDLDDYTREKYMYITSAANVGFNVYMNAATVKGANTDVVHTLKYDSTKIVPVDLCGFTYNKELTAGEIPNTNITIQNADLSSGKIEYKFNLQAGRNTGITNLVGFKALSELNQEPIIYTIQ